MLLALSLVTGLLDAVSILALGRVFVANMTGNVVFAGLALAGTPGLSLTSALFALAGFMIGAALGGALVSRTGKDRAVHVRAETATELGCVIVALIITVASGDPAASHGILHIDTRHGRYFGAAVTDVLALVLAVAMGVRNSAARKFAIPDLTSTVLTTTLTGIGADPWSGQRGHATRTRRLLIVATMLAGAALGAWLVLSVSVTAALAVAAALLLATTACAVQAARHPAPWRPSA
jgi:uncharacterized membrane protein YoaK (UPF0700 family)